MINLRHERDKLIDISNSLRGQVSNLEKEKENRASKIIEEKGFTSPNIMVSNDNLKESKLDQLRLEVE